MQSTENSTLMTGLEYVEFEASSQKNRTFVDLQKELSILEADVG